MNQPSKMDDGSTGILPTHGVLLKEEKLTMIAYMIPPVDQLKMVRTTMLTEKPEEFVFGMDRFYKDGQGIDKIWHSFLTIYHYKDGNWKIGVMPYNDNAVGEIDWNNAFWTSMAMRELKGMGICD